MVKLDDHGAEDDESEIVRRKFSMPKQKADRIQVLANEHYAKNQSQLVRSAIEDHAYTLEGRGRTLLQEALDEVKRVGEIVDELQKALNESDSDSEQPSTAEIAGAAPKDIVEGEVSSHDAIKGDMWPVYRKLADAYPAALSVDEFVSSGGLSETDVQHALIDLRDRGKIASSSVEGTTQYEITANESE
jgi:Arc/MetJ-type ribon-helix-helix transcriptional regulator